MPTSRNRNVPTPSATIAFHGDSLRITLLGSEATVEIAGVTAQGAHSVIAQPKGLAHFLVFGDTIGFRKVMAASNGHPGDGDSVR